MFGTIVVGVPKIYSLGRNSESFVGCLLKIVFSLDSFDAIVSWLLLFISRIIMTKNLTPIMCFYMTNHICINLHVLSDLVTRLPISLLWEQGFCVAWSTIRG